MAKPRVTRDDFLKDRQGKTFVDVLSDPRQPFDKVIEFFGDENRQRRMEESELHHDRAPLAGVVRELESDPTIDRFLAGTRPTQYAISPSDWRFGSDHHGASRLAEDGSKRLARRARRGCGEDSGTQHWWLSLLVCSALRDINARKGCRSARCVSAAKNSSQNQQKHLAIASDLKVPNGLCLLAAMIEAL